MRHIAIALFDDAEELDWAGPWEVLAMWTRRWPDDGWSVHTVSADGGQVRCAKGLRVVPDHSWATMPPADVVVYPGGRGTRRQVHDADVLDWVRRRAHAGVLMTSVCTGALVYAAAGLLRGRRATTHWAAVDELQRLDATITVDPDARFVDEGDVITSAGVSAGIDMALHLVARLASTGRAAEVRRAIQYDPAPPV